MIEPSGPVSISEARELPGLRLVVIEGVPSPWTQAAKGILHIKQLPYTLVRRTKEDGPTALEDWTGQASFPAAMFEDEPPRDGWAEILLLAERLAPKPALVPTDPEERALMFGISHEIAGEMGLGWCRRLGMVEAGLKADPPSPISGYLGSKYGAYAETMPLAPGRVHDVLDMLTKRLTNQRAAGHRYLLGPELTALDVYWATFCNLLSPLSQDRMPMADPVRAMFDSADPAIDEILAGGLLDHRDFIYEEHLVLPVVL
jgi:glutathione S-transferase